MIKAILRQIQERDIRWIEDHLADTIFYSGFWVRRRLKQAIASRSDRARGVMLDIGCGLKPYENVFAKYVKRHLGMEFSPNSGFRGNVADLYGDASAIPLASMTVDTVLCTEVLEHVSSPDKVIAEIARVLKPGGVAICTAPFFYPVHDSFDFFRYSPDGVATMMRSHDLKVEEVISLSGSGLTIAIMFNLLWFDIGFMWTKWLYPIGMIIRPVLLLLTCIVNVCGWILEKLISSTHMSFNHLTIARRPDTVSQTQDISKE
jgi:SAM-dependent methyltransferase